MENESENDIEMGDVVYAYMRYKLQLMHCKMYLIREFSSQTPTFYFSIAHVRAWKLSNPWHITYT